jgi:hypothetical protein
MSNVLTLQKLTPKRVLIDHGNMFGSAISTICPTQGPGEAGSPFEME